MLKGREAKEPALSFFCIYCGVYRLRIFPARNRMEYVGTTIHRLSCSNNPSGGAWVDRIYNAYCAKGRGKAGLVFTETSATIWYILGPTPLTTLTCCTTWLYFTKALCASCSPSSWLVFLLSARI